MPTTLSFCMTEYCCKQDEGQKGAYGAEKRVVDYFVRGQSTSDDVQVQDLGEFLLVGEQRVEDAIVQAAEGFVGRRQQRQFAGARDVLHEIGGEVFHNAIEFVENAVALPLQVERE